MVSSSENLCLLVLFLYAFLSFSLRICHLRCCVWAQHINYTVTFSAVYNSRWWQEETSTIRVDVSVSLLLSPFICLCFFLMVEEQQGLISLYSHARSPSHVFLLLQPQDGCKSTVRSYIMKHLQKYTKEKTLWEHRENTAFSIIDDKNQMLSHEYDRSCIVQNHDEGKHMFYKYVLFFFF